MCEICDVSTQSGVVTLQLAWRSVRESIEIVMLEAYFGYNITNLIAREYGMCEICNVSTQLWVVTLQLAWRSVREGIRIVMLDLDLGH